MIRDYEKYFNNIGIADDDKKIVLDYVETLFTITINIMNKSSND